MNSKFFIFFILSLVASENQRLQTADDLNITQFQRNEGLYFQSQGMVKISYQEWNLVTYVDLSVYTSRYTTLRKYYNVTENVCTTMKQKFVNTSIIQNCLRFTQATLPYLYEIESNQRNIVTSIVHDTNSANRKRRGLGRTISRLANVLYGFSSTIDIESIFNKIVESRAEKHNNLNLIQEKIRIVQTGISEANNTLNQIAENQRKIEKNIEYLNEQVQRNTQNINNLQIEFTLLEQAVIFEIILNQYVYEIQNLIAVINSAIHGKIHASVFSSNKLTTELREIKVELPIGTTLPFDLNSDTPTDLFTISEIVVFRKAEYLVFVVKIPLVSNDEYSIYQPIPIPIPFNNVSYTLIEPEIDYLALSNNNEKYFTLTENQWKACSRLRSHKICKGTHLIHYRASSNLCEIVSLTKMQIIPNTCNFKTISLNSSIWERLQQTNSWLYCTKYETATVVCSNPTRKFKIEIAGVGKLTTSPHCEIHLDKSILLPISNVKEAGNDIVPNNPNINEIINFRPKSIEKSIIISIEIHLIIMFVLVFILSIVILVIIKIRLRKITMYEPELPASQPEESPEL